MQQALDLVVDADSADLLVAGRKSGRGIAAGTIPAKSSRGWRGDHVDLSGVAPARQ